MNAKAVFAFSITLLLSSCNSYLVNSIDTKTGIKLSPRNLVICKGTDIKKYNGKPVGVKWQKANKMRGVALLETDLFKPIMNEYIFQILSPDYQKEFCHKIDLYNSDLNSRHTDKGEINPDYIVEIPNSVNLSSVFSELAVTKAVEQIKAKAKTKKIKMPTEFYTNFSNELRKEIITNSNSSAKLRYIVINVEGINLDSPINSMPITAMLQCGFADVLEKYKSGSRIIMGISGFLVTDFSTNAKIVEDNAMITAFEAAAKGESLEIQAIIEEIKIEASVEWSRSVNQTIHTTISVDGCNFFFPLWVRCAEVEN